MCDGEFGVVRVADHRGRLAENLNTYINPYIHTQDNKAFNALGREIQEANLQHVTTLMATFKDSLEVGGCAGV